MSTSTTTSLIRLPSRLQGYTGWLFVAAIVVQLVVLYLPDGSSAPHVAGLDSLVHIVIFAAVMVTGGWFGIDRMLLAALLVVHAVASEVIQHTVLPMRSGDWRDVAADLIGIGLGLLILRPARR